MPDSPLPNRVSLEQPAIYLEYGLDGACGDDTTCEVCEKGMRFRSPWRFEVGAFLCVALAIDGPQPARIEAEGIVADCSRHRDRCYQTTLAFTETPRELRANLGKFTARLLPSSLWQSGKASSQSGYN